MYQGIQNWPYRLCHIPIRRHLSPYRTHCEPYEKNINEEGREGVSGSVTYSAVQLHYQVLHFGLLYFIKEWLSSHIKYVYFNSFIVNCYSAGSENKEMKEETKR